MPPCLASRPPHPRDPTRGRASPAPLRTPPRRPGPCATRTRATSGASVQHSSSKPQRLICLVYSPATRTAQHTHTQTRERSRAQLSQPHGASGGGHRAARLPNVAALPLPRTTPHSSPWRLSSRVDDYKLKSYKRRSVREDDMCQASSVSSEVPGVARCPTAILANLSSWRTSQMRSAAQHNADNICRRPHASLQQVSEMLNVRSMSMLPRCSLAKECVQPPCGAQHWRQSAWSGRSATLNRPPSRGLSRARALLAASNRGGVMIRT